MSAVLSRAIPPGRADGRKRRRATRTGRERGCHLYITAEQLAEMGFDPYGAAPAYRIWPGPRGRAAVQLYREV